MKKAFSDAAELTRSTIFRVDDGWYDTYWYGERPDNKLGLISRGVHALRDRIAAARVRYAQTLCPQNAAGIAEHHESDLLKAGKG